MVMSVGDMARMEGRVAEMVGVVNAATAGLVSLLSDVIDTDAWQVEGIRSPEQWVTWQTGASPARARALVAMARALPELPATRAAFERGELSEDQARLIAAVVDPAHDERAAELGRLMTVPQLARALRGLERRPGDDTPKPARSNRRVGFGYDDDGTWWMNARLPGDEGALVQRALERARDAEFHARHPDPPTDDHGAARDSVTWADALVRLADAALTDLAPKGRPGERYQVLIHMPADAKAAAYLHLGPSIEDSVRRYHECDATIRYVLEQDGRIVALSRKQDTVDDKTRMLVEDRDGGCIIPGCGQKRWLHVHHIRHRGKGGETVLENLCCLCPTHHRAHHAGLLHIDGDPTVPGGLTITTAGGRVLGAAPPTPPARPPTEARRHVGLPEPTWQHPSGERIDWRWIEWG